LIDWFTVVAQIFNFLVLLVLLKLLLYDRIVQAMDRREQTIAGRLRDAQEKKEQAENEAESYRAERRKQEAQRDQYLEEARKTAQQRRDEMIEEARKEADELGARWRESVQGEQQQFLQTLRTEVGREVCAVTRRVLVDLADTDLEIATVSVFLRKLQDVKELDQLFEDQGGEVTVVTPFELADDQRDRIEQAVQKAAGSEGDVHFSIDKDLVLGLELRTGGRSLGWTVADYLEDLESTFQTQLDDASRDRQQQTAQSEDDAGEQASQGGSR